jgi:SAM-dependent methyltransferase
MSAERPINPYSITRSEPVTPGEVTEYLSAREKHMFDPYGHGINRNGVEYLELFQGLAHVLDYARTLPVHTVLDVGAGLTRGINDIRKSDMGRQLDYFATVLTPRPEIAQNLGFERTLVAGVETLTGVPDASIALVLGGNSLAYSIVPEVAMQQVNRVLIPGGVLKATFMDVVFARDGDTSQLPRMKSHLDFSHALKSLGYDVVVYPPASRDMGFDILLAVKPGAKEGISANSLMLEDYKTYFGQMDQLRGR